MKPRCRVFASRWGQSLLPALLLWGALDVRSDEPFSLVPAGIHAVVSTNALEEDLFDEYQVRSWSSADGLAQNHVDAVARDRQGYLWVASWVGLSRFNGREFVTFAPVNTPALKSETISDLLRDRDGEVWATTKHGLYRIRGTQFDYFGGEHGLPNENIHSIAEDPAGYKWLATDHGLVRFDGIKAVTHLLGPSQQLVQNICFMPDGKALVFIVNEARSTVYSFDPATGKFGPAPALFQPEGRPVLRREIVGPDRDGVLWFRTENAIHHARPDGRVEKYRDLPETMKSERVLLLCDSQGDVWFAGNQPGVLERHSRGRISRMDLEASRQITSFNSLLEEPGGLYWLCTGQGLVQLKARTVRNFGRRHGLLHDYVYSVAALGGHRTLLGTRRWPAIIDQARSELLLFQLPGVNTTSRALLPNADGSFWVTDGNLGPTHVAADGTVSRTSLAPDWPFRAEQYVFYRDSQERLWIGAETNLYVVQGGRVRTLAQGDLPGLPADDIRVVREMPDRTIWLGGNGSGITVLAPDAKSVVTRHTVANGLSHDDVWTLELGEQGDVWAGTAHGLNRIRQGRCQKLLPADGLQEGVINQILRDKHGYLWLTGMKGIYRLDPSQVSDYLEGRAGSIDVLPVTTDDGLINAETNGEQQPAGFVAADGRLWVPTIAGVAVVDPSLFRSDARPAPPLVEQIVLDDEILYHNGPGRDDRSSLDRPFRFAAGRGRLLEIKFAAPAAEMTGTATYEVRLNGFDNDWRPFGRQTTVSYPSLRPGNYSLDLRVANHHRQTSDAAKEFSFHLAPYPYETVWFWAGLVLLAVAAAYYLHRRRLAFVSHIQELEQREALVADRQRIARDMHDDLGSRLTHISLLADVARQGAASPADAKLQALNLAAREAARAVEEIVWSANPGNDTLASLVGYLTQHAENTLSAAGIRCRVDTALEWPDVYLSPPARHGVFMAFKEAIHNILKHAAATEVRLFLQPGPEEVQVRITDNGRGFALDDRRQDDQDGLGNMPQRLTAVGGRFAIHSTPGAGTTVEFWFPFRAPGPERREPDRSA